MQSKYYITTTLPYVNSEPHIGFGLEIVAADVLARFHRLIGDAVIFNTGSDEHGQKIWQKAVDQGVTPKEYVDQTVTQFQALKDDLNLSYTHFIRTSDEHHIQAAQTLWQLCQKNDDIYKAQYQHQYCVGCELTKLESELVDHRCPLHPTLELETRNEENYFFRFSKYQKPLLKYYQSHPEFIKPEHKLNEITAFVSAGLQDFSISRLKTNMPWGVPVPDDDQHVMYVWFDALVNYISTLGWPNQTSSFEQFWPGTQIAGKDNLRQQAAMWQAMLLSANLPMSKQILINGFISINGQKMSKTLGNVISPQQLIERYGIDGTRWILISLGPIGNDIDLSWQQLDQIFQSELANGLGNLASRITKLAEKIQLSGVELDLAPTPDPQYLKLMENSDVSATLDLLKHWTAQTDQFLSQNKPWLLEGEQQQRLILDSVTMLYKIAYHAQVVIPETAEKILTNLTGAHIKATPPLFPRINTAEGTSSL